MAGKVLKYELEYREKGEPKIDVLPISFVSNWCVREFNELSETQYGVKINWNKYQNIKSLISSVNAGGDVGKTAEELEEEAEQVVQDTLKFGDFNYEQRRFELTKVLLEDNGIKNEKYYDFNFWDRQVEPIMQNGLLEQSIFKDIELDKKKVHQK